MATPVRKQYLDIKAQYPNEILLYRMGDFYETFDEDAQIASRDLEIVLTQREMGHGEIVPLAGIPYHALENYLAKLLKKGHRVAIAEHTSTPDGKGIVDRSVTRVVTPGTILESNLLESSANNYLAAVIRHSNHAAIAHVDISTGEFGVTQIEANLILEELARLSPSEVIIDENDAEIAEILQDKYKITLLYADNFKYRTARQSLLQLYKVKTLDAYGCESLELAIAAAGAVLAYLKETHPLSLTHLGGLYTYSIDEFMTIDPQTRRNLELFEGGQWGTAEQSLLKVLNLTYTPMGARVLRNWVGQPLLDVNALNQRLDAVEWFHTSELLRSSLKALLSEVSDVERIIQRTASGIVLPRELVGLKKSLITIPSIIELIFNQEDSKLKWLLDGLDPCVEAVSLLQESLNDDPQGDLGQGKIIREGYFSEIDDLISATRDARKYISALEQQEKSRTGIGNLKIGYNRVFGYFFEVSNSHLNNVPDDYIRKQTLVNAERFFTEELKQYENKVLNASEKLQELETQIYKNVCSQVLSFSTRILGAALAIARIDALLSLGEAASRYGYVRPSLSNDENLNLVSARHPVVERFLPPGTFVSNDSIMSTEASQLVILTGPNMAGKSTYLRQVALVVLMAQIGSFVPAEQAHVGLVDRIFTRVGLQDDLTSGQSTFMIEMVETASILNHATKRSLLILDELGRGTSTFDGLSIAQAVAEHIHNEASLGCRTLFATHYHELTTLAERLPRVTNLSILVSESNGGIAFFHRIVSGGTDKSYGVQVAQLAGLPFSVIERAKELLQEHETLNGRSKTVKSKNLPGGPAQGQFDFHVDYPPEIEKLFESIKEIDLDDITPRQALDKLAQIISEAKNG